MFCRSKSVRIDYNSVVAHVDFEEPTLIDHPELDESEAIKEETSEEFIRGLLTVGVLSPIGEEKIEDMESETHDEDIGAGDLEVIEHPFVKKHVEQTTEGDEPIEHDQAQNEEEPIKTPEMEQPTNASGEVTPIDVDQKPLEGKLVMVL